MATRGPYAKGVVKREELLDAALTLFAEHGYDRTSMREVARAAGLSQTGLLHHFASKEELFVEVLRRRDRRNEELYDARHGAPLSAEGLVSIVRHNADERGLVRLFVAMSAESTEIDGPARSFFVERYRALVAGVASDLKERQDAGELARDLDPEALAAILIAAADGLQLQWLLDSPTSDMGARLELLWDVVRRVPLAPAPTRSNRGVAERVCNTDH